MCVGCDISALRKMCGFLGHTAKYGCSKCLKPFSGTVGSMDYSGFKVSDWPKRNLKDHRKKSRLIKKAQTQTEKEYVVNSRVREELFLHKNKRLPLHY